MPMVGACSAQSGVESDDSRLGSPDSGDAAEGSAQSDAGLLASGLPDLSRYDAIQITDQPALVLPAPPGCTNANRVWGLKLRHPEISETLSGRWTLTHFGCKEGYHGITEFSLRPEEVQTIFAEIRKLARISSPTTAACVDNPHKFLVQFSRDDHRVVPADPDFRRATAYLVSPESYCSYVGAKPGGALPELEPFNEFGGYGVASGGAALVSFLASRYYQTATED